MSLGDYKGRYNSLDKRNKMLVGVALVLLILGAGGLIGRSQWRETWGGTWGEWSEDTFTLLAPQERSQVRIYDLIEVGGNIWGGTGTSGYLFRYMPTISSTWSRRCSQLMPGYHIISLVEYDGLIYAGTGNRARLFRADPSGSGWTSLTSTPESQDYVTITEYNGVIYGGTEDDGYLLAYTVGESDDWTTLAGPLPNDQAIQSITVYDGVIYATTKPSSIGVGGYLYSYIIGESDDWTELSENVGIDKYTYSIQEHEGTLYAVSGKRLLAYTPGVDSAWRTVAEYQVDTAIRTLTSVGYKLYAITYSHPVGDLLSWAPGDTEWTKVAETGTDNQMISLMYYDEILYSGCNTIGGLYGYYIGLPETAPEPEPEDPELDTGGLLEIRSFWIAPSTPQMGEAVVWKVSGVGIDRVNMEWSIVDAITGEVTVESENLMYTDGVWWASKTYIDPCRVVATPTAYGADGNTTIGSITLDIEPDTSSPPTVEETVSETIESTVQVIQDAGEVVSRFMISAADWSLVNVPEWVPALVLLSIVVLIIRRPQN